MLPYCLGGYLSYFDGLFESVSGFTGTGATVITDLEILLPEPASVAQHDPLARRPGIVVIFIALLPEAGQSTVYMYNAESTGPTRERVLPRLHDMTQVLFRMYMAFTAAAFVIFLLCGMDFLGALNHALSTVSAGGFSTYNASAAHFESPAVEAWMTFFMILTGGNYGLYYQAWQKLARPAAQYGIQGLPADHRRGDSPHRPQSHGRFDVSAPTACAIHHSRRRPSRRRASSRQTTTAGRPFPKASCWCS